MHAEGLDIRVLHGGVTEIAGVRIIGATLWTDLCPSSNKAGHQSGLSYGGSGSLL